MRTTQLTLILIGIFVFGLTSLKAQTTHFVSVSATGANNGSSWANAFVNLQDAVDAATAGDEIWVARGVYLPTKDITGNANPMDPREKTFFFSKALRIYGGFQGTETILTQRNCTPANATVLSGDLGIVGDRVDNSYHVCYSQGLSLAFVLDCFTISDGNGEFNLSIKSGGGWYNQASAASSSMTLRNILFTQNAGAEGGAFYNDARNGGVGSPTFENCTFFENLAERGGGICLDARNGGQSSPVIQDCRFERNANEAIHVLAEDGLANPTVTGCDFEQNTTLNTGGALYINASSNGISRGTYTDCNFTSNTTDSHGGAVSVFGFMGDAKSTFENCTFTSNSTGSGIHYGGAVFNNDASPEYFNCQFINNTAFDGGGMYNNGAQGMFSGPRVNGCTFESNSATNYGGAVYNQGQFGQTSSFFAYCRFINNTAPKGGATYEDGTGTPTIGSNEAVYYSSVFSRNTATLAGGASYLRGNGGKVETVYASCSFSGNNSPVGAVFNFEELNGSAFDVKAFNLASWGNIGPAFSSSGTVQFEIDHGVFETSTLPNCIGNCQPGGNPQFANPVADDLNLTAGSPAIDVGNNTWIPTQAQYQFDIVGNPRIGNGRIDFGAYEFNVSIPPCPRVLYVNKTATGANNGVNWGDAYLDLQDALAFARANTCVDTILIAKGVYYPSATDQQVGFEVVNDVEIYGGFPNTGNPWFGNRDLVLHETVLSGDIGVLGDPSDNTYSVLTAGYNGFQTAIYNSGTLVDGLSLADGFSGIRLQASGAHLVEAVFNQVKIHGMQGGSNVTDAGIVIWHANQIGGIMNPRFIECEVYNNVNTSAAGGVVIWGAGNTPLPLANFSPFFDRCTIRDNQGGSKGGGVSLLSQAGPEFHACKFERNVAQYSNSINTGGGAVFAETSVNLNLTAQYFNCLFAENQGGRGGGAISVSHGFQGVSNHEFINCTFASNAAVNGGQLYGYADGNVTIDFKNCIFWGSQGGSSSNVFYLRTSTGSSPVSNINLDHCLIDAPNCNLPASLGAPGPFYIFFMGVPGFPQTTFLNCLGGMIYNQDPMFRDPLNGDYSLLPSSPAIDAGDNSLLQPFMVQDLAGIPRINPNPPGIVDMGSFENYPGFVGVDPEQSGDDERLKLFPLPCQGELNIQLDEGRIRGGKLFHIGGKLVDAWQGEIKSLDLRLQPAGIYILEVETRKGLLRKKFSLQ